MVDRVPWAIYLVAGRLLLRMWDTLLAIALLQSFATYVDFLSEILKKEEVIFHVYHIIILIIISTYSIHEWALQ